MKQTLVILAVVVLACCMGVPKNGSAAAPEAQAAPQTQAPALTGDTFTGTITSYEKHGSMASPWLFAYVTNADGQKAAFALKKSAAVTDVAGKTIGHLHGFKEGKKVEIKFTVKDGKNEAVAWHYLD